jgi:cytochrome c oxidase subunit 4
MTTPTAQTTHVRPNYIRIWLYLFVMTILEVLLAFELPVSQNLKLILLLFLAIWKALLVALYFMHLKFERWRLRLIFIVPLPLAVILVSAVIMEKIR